MLTFNTGLLIGVKEVGEKSKDEALHVIESSVESMQKESKAPQYKTGKGNLGIACG